MGKVNWEILADARKNRARGAAGERTKFRANFLQLFTLGNAGKI